MDNKNIALIILLVHILHEAKSQLTANLTISIPDTFQRNLTIEFNATSFQRLVDVLCNQSNDCYSFQYQLSTGHLLYTHCERGFENPNGNQEPTLFGFNYISNTGSFKRVSQQEVCSGTNVIIGILKNNDITGCGNKCIYIFTQSSVISGFIEMSKTVSNIVDSQCPNVCNTSTQSSSATQPTSQAAVTASKETLSNQTIASTTLSTNVFLTYTDGATHNASTELTSEGEPETNIVIIAVTVSVGAILIVTVIIFIIVCVVLRNRNKSKQHEGRDKGVQEKQNEITLDANYTTTSDYNSIDINGNGTTIYPVTNKVKNVNQYQNSLFPVETKDSLSTSNRRNVNGNHVGDIYAVVNKPNTASDKIKTKSKVENTPTSNNVPTSDDYSYVDKPGSHNSPSSAREGQVTEYSTLHQVNRMSDDTYTLLGEQLARQNHVTNIGEHDVSGSRDNPSDIQIVYLSAKGTGRHDEMKRTSVDI